MGATGQQNGPAIRKQYTSGNSADTTTWASPSNMADWAQIIGAGSTVLVDESGNSVTITTDAAEPNATIPGPWKAFTSTTATRVRMGNGAMPEPISPPPTAVPATTSALGGVEMSVAPAAAATPIAVGDNDPRLPGYWKTAATQTASWSLAIDTLYILNTTNTVATATLPAIDDTNDGHRVGMFNAGTTAAVWTPASGDTVGGTAASNATLAGPAAGVMKTLVANLATRRWIPLA